MKVRALALSIVLTVVAGCGPANTAAPTRPGASARAPRPAAAATTPPVPLAEQPPVTLPGAGGLTPVAPPSPGVPGAGVVSNNGAALSGVVLAPPGVVSNNGGKLVSNNGGGVLSDMGAGLVGANRYGTLAFGQAPLAGARVYLLDAQGRPLRGADGQAVSTLADAQGRYAFTGALPTRNLVLAVELADGKGRLQAVLTADGQGPRQVDLDLVATLSTNYILDRYVAPQADQQAVFDRLPGPAEAETRAKVAAALGDGEVPASFEPAVTVPLVDDLRRRDPAVDAQLEAVKKLLLVAGVSDLGNGLPAVEAPLRDVAAVLPAPDGGLYLVCPADRRIWKLGADGKLRTAVGKGQPSASSLDGVAGPEAGLTWIAQVALDGAGRLVIHEDGGRDYSHMDAGIGQRLTRLEADGRLRQFERAGSFNVPGEGDEVLSYEGDEEEGTLYAQAPGTPAKAVRQLAGVEAMVFSLASAQGRAATGTFLLSGIRHATENRIDPTRYRLDRQTYALTRVGGHPDAPGPAELGLMDPFGNVFHRAEVEAAHGPAPGPLLRVHRPDGTTKDLPEAGTEPGYRVSAAVLLPGGAAYLADADQVFRLEDGQRTHVAGRAENAGTGDASDLTIDGSGLALMPDGSFMVADYQGGKLWRIDAAGKYEQVGTDEQFAGVRAVRTDRAGNVYVLDYEYDVVRLDAKGEAKVVYAHPGEQRYGAILHEDLITDFVVSPEGQIHMVRFVSDRDLDGGQDTMQVQVLRLEADGRTTRVAASLPEEDLYTIALDPAGRLHVGSGYTDEAWRLEGDRLVSLGTCPDKGTTDTFAVDAEGRIYYTAPNRNVIYRYDPATKARIVVAGAGGRIYAGSGVDDSLDHPHHLVFAPDGDGFFIDGEHRQIKRIPAELLK